MTYPQPRFIPGFGFFNLFTKYTNGRELYWETSTNGINWNVSLTSAIAGNFSVAAAFNLKYDNNPLPGVQKSDYLSSLSLVYSLQSSTYLGEERYNLSIEDIGQ